MHRVRTQLRKLRFVYKQAMLSDNWAKGTIINFILFLNISFMDSCHSVSREKMQCIFFKDKVFNRFLFYVNWDHMLLIKRSLFAHGTPKCFWFVCSGAPRAKLPIPENLVITWSTNRPSVRTTGIPTFTLTLSSYFGSPGESWLHINVVINSQLSKQGICWPVSPDRIAGSGVDP